MSYKDINAMMQLGGGTEAEWNLTNVPVPAKMLAYAIDSKVFKLGDGVTLFANLPVFFDVTSMANVAEFRANFPAITGADAGTVMAVNASGTGYILSNIKLADLVQTSQMNTLLAQKAPITHTHTTSSIAGLKSAALRDVGTQPGNVPVIDATGKFPTSIVPMVSGDSIEKDDLLSYLILAQMADDDAVKLSLPAGYADEFEDESGIDTVASVNATYNVDKYTGTDISLVSKSTTVDSSPASTRLLFTCESTATPNADLLVEISRDDGSNWSGVVLEKSRMSSATIDILAGDCTFNKSFIDAPVDLSAGVFEDVKGSITSLIVDVADTSGHFNAAVGVGYIGCIVTTADGIVTISAITGDGTAANSVTVVGTLAVGSHVVTSIHGLKYAENKISTIATTQISTTVALPIGSADINVLSSTDTTIDDALCTINVGTEYLIYLNLTWTPIVKLDGLTWQYKNALGLWSNATSNNPLSAVTEAVALASNQMTFGELRAVKATALSPLNITTLTITISTIEISNVVAHKTIDMSAPEGTSIRYRIRTINGKTATVRGVRIKWA